MAFEEKQCSFCDAKITDEIDAYERADRNVAICGECVSLAIELIMRNLRSASSKNKELVTAAYLAVLRYTGADQTFVRLRKAIEASVHGDGL